MRRLSLLLATGVFLLGVAVAPHHLVSRPADNPDFVHFESPHVHPASMTPSGNRLLVVNTPDNRLSVFDISQGPPSYLNRIAEIPVGMEPVSVCARSDSEAWVVNMLSDDVSIVNLTTMHVRATLRVGDEPGDVVFAGTPARAYVSVGQQDVVKVYDPATLAPVTTIPIAGRLPRALARTADGTKVYVALAQSGSRTTLLSADEVPDDSIPQDPNFPKDTLNGPAPKVGLIVENQVGSWYDMYGNMWNSKIKYSLNNLDVAEIATASNTVSRSFGGTVAQALGGDNFAIAVSPTDGRIALANTHPRNILRFEPQVVGYLAETQLSFVTQGGIQSVRKLDPTTDYTVVPGTKAEADSAIGTPTGVAYASAGNVVYVTSLATDRLAVVNPTGSPLTMIRARIRSVAGPTGVVVDDARNAIYVVGRYYNQIQTLSSSNFTQTGITAIGFDPTPVPILNGRRVFYAGKTSAHGDQSCATCHTFADTDNLSWDLGNPSGAYQSAPAGQPDTLLQGFHPMKGPMMTQSLRGLPNTGVFHWRGDRADLNAFNPAFISLMGRATQLSDSEMTALNDFVMPLAYPPNPNQNLDRTLPDAPPGSPSALRGHDYFTNVPVQGDKRCVDCHTVGLGTNALLVNHGDIQESQDFKVPQLRGLWRAGSFNDSIGAVNKRGFGFMHDGHAGTLFEFLQSPRFTFADDDDRRDVQAYLLAFDTGMAPSVGAQVTFDGTNLGGADQARLDTLAGQANVGACDLIAKGRLNGMPRGWLYQGSGQWKSDLAADPPIETVDLLALAGPGSEITVTGVPPGSGTRMGIDRDRDGYLDGDELVAGSDPGNPNSTPALVGVPGNVALRDRLTAVGPNPFRGTAEVSFALARPGRVELAVFDIMGREVRTLARGPMTAGSQRRVWDGQRNDGSNAPAGVYFVRLVTPGGHWTRTLVRIR